MTSAASDPDPERAAPEPIGAYLARQRTLRGISLDELEALTHIPRRSLERLESGFHDGKPDGFVRGFVRTVSEAIGLDAEDAVARMLAEPATERRIPQLSLRRVGLVLALGLGLAAVGALLPGLLSLRGESGGLVAETAAATAPPVPMRRDAVRSLADGLAADKPARPLPSRDAGDPDPGPGAAIR